MASNGTRRTISTPCPTIGSSAAASPYSLNRNDGGAADLWARYEHLKFSDVKKNALLEVISRYEYLSRQHHESSKEREEERTFQQHFEQRERTLQASLQQLQRLLNRDPFILILLDGDGFIFNDALLNGGEAGGTHTADILQRTVAEWASSKVLECPQDVKVVVRVYANISGLSDVCYKAGVVDAHAKVADFARGFCRGKTLFDFVDVGYGKDRADGKIAENFKLYLYDYHCRQILLGCSHDNGYARLLENYCTDAEALQRVTLLEGLPFEKELRQLPFRTVKFQGMFRERKIVLNTCAPDLLTSDTNPRLDARVNVFTPGGSISMLADPNTTACSSNVGPTQFDGLNSYQRSLHVRNDSSISSLNPGDWGPRGGGWAAVAKAPAGAPQTIDLTSQKESVAVIRRNKKGQRIDEPLDYEREDVLRLKRMKLCNQFYLGEEGCCHSEDKCAHRHDYRASAAELKCLRLVARETPCKRGTGCDNIKCIYGHRCPFPVATEGTMRGIGCLNGDNCRFPREMHGMDTVPVKTVRATGAF